MNRSDRHQSKKSIITTRKTKKERKIFSMKLGLKQDYLLFFFCDFNNNNCHKLKTI